jgi:hypothetical protein
MPVPTRQASAVPCRVRRFEMDNRQVPALDRFLPAYDVHEVHSVELPVPPERAVAAALAIRAAPDPLVALLFRLRGLPTAGTIQDAFAAMGFEVLHRSTTEFVVGVAGSPWRARARLVPFSRVASGTVRMAADFRAELLPAGRKPAVDGNARRCDRRGRSARVRSLLAARGPVLGANQAPLARRRAAGRHALTPYRDRFRVSDGRVGSGSAIAQRAMTGVTAAPSATPSAAL